MTSAVPRGQGARAQPFRTGKRMYTTATSNSEADLELERRRRAVLCAYGTATGLFPPPYASSKVVLDRTIRRPDGGGGSRLSTILHGNTKLLRSPTVHHPGIKAALKSLSRADRNQLEATEDATLPSVRRSTVGLAGPDSKSDKPCESQAPVEPQPLRPSTSCAALQSGSCVGPNADASSQEQSNEGTPVEASEQPTETPITQVAVASISDPCLSDPMECVPRNPHGPTTPCQPFCTQWDTGNSKHVLPAHQSCQVLHNLCSISMTRCM